MADARIAAAEGLPAVVLSNHGGRQLDGAPATLDLLRDAVDAVGDDIEVLIDGGVRRGSDIVAARALGARAVMVGRPVPLRPRRRPASGASATCSTSCSPVPSARWPCSAPPALDDLTDEVLRT